LPEREEHKKIFDLLLYLLQELEKKPNRKRYLVLSSYFLLRTLKELGYAPHFRECIRCQSKLKKGGNYFDYNGAGTVCPACNQAENESFGGLKTQISDHALIGLRILNENSSLKLAKIKANDKVFKELTDLIESYAEYVIESELKSKKFIKQVD
jgi:DNA repair protein RecO